MRWEELTGDLFPQAVKQAEGVCLLPTSCIERHGHHLPLGTDWYIGHALCDRVAELEPVLVYPDLVYTQILEARHMPGCIGIQPDLILKLLENICSEISRNGLKKIVIINTHGGNSNLIYFFAQAQLASPRDYVIYVADTNASDVQSAPLWETKVDGHAGESETSAILAIRPDLVHKESIPTNGEGMPRERLKTLRDKGTYMGIWWYADHPTHYCGDALPATAEKGQRALEDRARALAEVIRQIKADKETPRLQEEFFKKTLQH